jgi:hypothetical protein
MTLRDHQAVPRLHRVGTSEAHGQFALLQHPAPGCQRANTRHASLAGIAAGAEGLQVAEIVRAAVVPGHDVVHHQGGGVLPDHVRGVAVAPQLAVRCQQQHGFRPALAHQQPIKGIAMVAIGLQLRHRQQMGVAKRQPAKTLQRYLALQLGQIHMQAADRHLHRHLP